jgi:choline dehydrogenase-like flavoprotein
MRRTLAPPAHFLCNYNNLESGRRVKHSRGLCDSVVDKVDAESVLMQAGWALLTTLSLPQNRRLRFWRKLAPENRTIVGMTLCQSEMTITSCSESICLAPGAGRSDAELASWLRKAVSTVHHPSGTCAMGTHAEAVLEPDLRVKGIERLRVVDGSALPDLVSGNINACVLMVAEKASDAILGRPPLVGAIL